MKLEHAEGMAQALMQEHKLDGWRFAFDTSLRRFGCCRFRDSRITLSRKLVELNDAGTVRNVILHEVAHALAGFHAGHGQLWRETAAAIGCDGERCYNPTLVATPEPRYKAVCAYCGYVAKAHRARRCRYSCPRCSHSFNERYVLVFKRNI